MYICEKNNRDFFFATDADDMFYIPYLLNNTIKDLYMKNGKLYNNRNVKPVLLHLGGNVNGNKYLNYLDYNTKKIIDDHNGSILIKNLKSGDGIDILLKFPLTKDKYKNKSFLDDKK